MVWRTEVIGGLLSLWLWGWGRVLVGVVAACEFVQGFGIDLARVEEAHDKLLAGAAEDAVDQVAQGVAGGLGLGDGGAVKVGSTFQLPRDLALVDEPVQDRLHGVVGKRRIELFLDGGDGGLPQLPEDVHDLEFERGKGFVAGRHVCGSPT
jgi:hypothetical protein